MCVVFLTVADLFAKVMLPLKCEARWFRNATKCIAPQGGVAGFVSFADFRTRSTTQWPAIHATPEDTLWTPVGDRCYCVGVLCADGDLNGASAQPVVIFSQMANAKAISCGLMK